MPMNDHRSPTQRLDPDTPLAEVDKRAQILLNDFQASDAGAVRVFGDDTFANRSEVGLPEARDALARYYSFADWSELKELLANRPEEATLSRNVKSFRQAIENEDLSSMRSSIKANPELVRSYVNQWKRALTFACERGKLQAAKLLVEHGADPREDGDSPVTRASLHHVDVLRWLIEEHNVDPEVMTGGDHGPLILSPAETLQPDCLRYLLSCGANANRVYPEATHQGNAMDVVFATYVQKTTRAECLSVLIEYGGKLTNPIKPEMMAYAAMDIHLHRTKELACKLDAEPDLVHGRIDHPQRNTCDRWLPLADSTLLHVACEWPNEAAAALLLERGADPNARAGVDEDGFGGQTPLFHALSQYHFDPVVELLLLAGADPSLQARVTGYGAWKPAGASAEVIGTALDYARLYPGDGHGSFEGAHQAKEELLAKWTSTKGKEHK